MEVARSFETIRFTEAALLTIGTFDGVHRGHRYLLEQARERAKEHHYGLVIVTFDPCPAVVLRPALGRYQLTTAEQKLTLLGALDPAVVAMLDFTPQLSYLSATEFMDALEARLDLRELWFGEDFRFGRGRGGDLQMLVERGRESGFSLHVVSRRMEDKKSISSSRIRQALSTGDVEGAIPLLGYPFNRSGSAATACAWSEEMHTAACYTIAPHLALPADGIYAVVATGPAGNARTVAEVRGGDPVHQILVRASEAPDAVMTIEFIRRLCTADDYRERPRLWLDQASELLHDWQRPEYGPSGHY